jgi:hypothetical protein
MPILMRPDGHLLLMLRRDGMKLACNPTHHRQADDHDDKDTQSPGSTMQFHRMPRFEDQHILV